MVGTVVRRRCDPQVVQQLWQAIIYIRQQKQISNEDRIIKFMVREYTLKESDCVKELERSVNDGLIEQYLTVACKGQNVGTEQNGYRIPEIIVDKGDHDWYCFTCHKPGEVLECCDCWRVYHTTCTKEDYSGETFLCAVCKAMRQKPRIKRKQVNKLLSYTVRRLKDKTRELHTLFSKELEDRFPNFVYHYMDINTMESKTRARKYRYLEQFHVDAQIIYHIIIIVFGDFGAMADLAKIMIRDCKYDLDEIKQCSDCYGYSNAKPADWFAQPCRPPHRLVYAKQRGFSHWPAKVINIDEQNHHDVRFFGGWHQRALIPKSSIKDISTSHKAMHVKKTPGFVKAMKELALHQRLISQMESDPVTSDTEAQSDSEDIADSPKPEKEAKKRPKYKSVSSRSSISSPSSSSPLNKSNSPATKAKLKQFGTARVHIEKLTFPLKKNVLETCKVDNDDEESRTSLQFVDSLDDDEDDQSKEPPKKQRKFRHYPEEQDASTNVISSSNIPEKQALTPDNQVTSSEDKIQSPKAILTSDTSTQTSKKLSSLGKQPNKFTQTDTEIQPGTCNCDSKYTRIFNDFKSRLEVDHKDEKDRALRELEHRLKKDFEEDKQQAVSRAMSNLQREVDRVRRQVEERYKNDKVQYMDEMKKVAQKHKTELSICKKKQWCYNCEEEAMYHCCWNTSYCSIKCQQEHWHKEHKRMCRRKR